MLRINEGLPSKQYVRLPGLESQILDTVIREGHRKKSEGCEGASHVDTQKMSIPGKGTHKCRDSEAEVSLIFKNSRRTSMTAAEKAKDEY